MRIVLAALIVLALTGCPGKLRKPELPQCAVAPELQVVERHVYVPLPKRLTTPEPIAEGPLSECPMVARERRAAIERANAKLREAGAIQGTEVAPVGAGNARDKAVTP